jgi:hypothetical protein
MDPPLLAPAPSCASCPLSHWLWCDGLRLLASYPALKRIARAASTLGNVCLLEAALLALSLDPAHELRPTLLSIIARYEGRSFDDGMIAEMAEVLNDELQP